MNRNNKCVWICIFLVIPIVFSFFMADKMSPNQATIWGGALSVIATVGVGCVAFWQNKKYKELADDMNDMICMPEIYRPKTIQEMTNNAETLFNKASYVSTESGNTVRINCGQFNILKPPLINLKVLSISCGEKNTTNYSGCYSYYLDNEGFSLEIRVPETLAIENSPIVVTFSFENLYGTQYKKQIQLEIASSRNIDETDLSNRHYDIIKCHCERARRLTK